ncbi:MAG: hypothetical protein EOP06_08990 [Proteobacteria bacterium]|nr:MAG: hypothetical protein EOP06_08990 [Pseudomonadota bacterium]
MNSVVGLLRKNPKIVFMTAGIAFGLSMGMTFLYDHLKNGGQITPGLIAVVAFASLGIAAPIFGRVLARHHSTRANERDNCE